MMVVRHFNMRYWSDQNSKFLVDNNLDVIMNAIYKWETVITVSTTGIHCVGAALVPHHVNATECQIRNRMTAICKVSCSS